MERWREVYSISVDRAHHGQRFVELVRAAKARGDWQAAGCSSSEEWLAQILAGYDDNTATAAERAEAAPGVDERDLPAR